MKHKAVVCLVALLIFVFLPLSSSDWIMFNHDPNHTNYSESAVPTKPVVIWTYPTPNISSVIVHFSPSAPIPSLTGVQTTSPQPTANIPEFSWLTILPILLTIPIALIIERKLKAIIQ